MEELSQEVREQLEIARSKVKRRLSYGAFGLLAFTLIYNLLTPPVSETIVIAIVTACISWIAYWFGNRSKSK